MFRRPNQNIWYILVVFVHFSWQIRLADARMMSFLKKQKHQKQLPLHSLRHMERNPRRFTFCSIQIDLWMYCPWHAAVKGNNWADRLTSKVTITKACVSEELRSLRHYHCLRAQSQGHHNIDCLEERGTERGSALPWKGEKGSSIASHTNTGTVSKATLGKLLRDGVECIGAYPCI